jgi:hypothetical protein
VPPFPTFEVGKVGKRRNVVKKWGLNAAQCRPQRRGSTLLVGCPLSWQLPHRAMSDAMLDGRKVVSVGPCRSLPPTAPPTLGNWRTDTATDTVTPRPRIPSRWSPNPRVWGPVGPRVRYGQATRPQDRACGRPLRGARLAHSSSAAASGLTPFACPVSFRSKKKDNTEDRDRRSAGRAGLRQRCS